MPFLARLFVPLLLVIGLNGCASEAEVKPTTILLEVTSTAPAEPLEEPVELGSLVTLEVTSEVDGLLHVHGFNEKVNLVAGQTTETTFKASMTGGFEVETHDPDAVWMKLAVS